MRVGAADDVVLAAQDQGRDGDGLESRPAVGAMDRDLALAREDGRAAVSAMATMRACSPESAALRGATGFGQLSSM